MSSRLSWIMLMIVLLVGCSVAPATSENLRGAVFDPPRPLADFSLTSTTGELFTLSQHKGETILIYFGYRSCPDFCPTTFAELKRVYTTLHEPVTKLKIVFVTVDPERDSLENLTLYTQAFHEDFIGLRAEGETLKQVLDEFDIVAEKRQVGDSAMAYLIDHTASVFLIDPSGQLKMQYLYGTDYRDIVHDLRLILGVT